MKSSSALSFLLLAGVAAAASFSYLTFKRSGDDLANKGSNAEAYVGNTFPPILVFDAKPNYEKGCFDLKWISINTTSCTASWRPEIVTNGGEKVCQGKTDHITGVRTTTNVGEISYSVTCTGPAGTVSKSIKVKN